jgi:hypothetical protein
MMYWSSNTTEPYVFHKSVEVENGCWLEIIQSNTTEGEPVAWFGKTSTGSNSESSHGP